MNPLTKGCYPQCGAAKGMNLRAGGGIKYDQNAWVTSVLTSPALISKTVLLTLVNMGSNSNCALFGLSDMKH